MAKPFIKWVGGKTQLLPSILPLFPRKIKTYFEPFIGGGAVYFSLAAEGRFGRAVINDWNADLANVYAVVRSHPNKLTEALLVIEDEYSKNPMPMYNMWRSKDPEALTSVLRAARFIFLNKAGFNGLHRVNKAGKFNVPWGHKPTIKTFDEDNIRDCETLLNSNTDILTGDFEDAVKDAGEGDFVYLDPPYAPVSKTSDFASYTENGFGWDEQKRVAKVFRELHARGANVIASNSSAPKLLELYEGFEIREVNAKRNVNSKGSGRGAVKEIVVISKLTEAT